MQRYRVNFPLLIGIVVGTIVVFGGGFALWQFQRNRTADRYITRAADAREEGDLVESIKQLGKYLSIRRNDDAVKVQLASTYADLMDEPDVEPKFIRKGLQILEGTVSEQPENQEVRRKLIDVYLERGGRKQALDHVLQLINQRPNDPELEEIRSDCLFRIADPKAVDHAMKMVGYDKVAGDFKSDGAMLADKPLVYFRLATLLRDEKREDELSRKVIDRMIEVNSEEGLAYLYSGQFLRGTEDKDLAEEQFAKSLELAPDDPQVVRLNALLLIEPEEGEEVQDEQYDRAIAMIDKCLESNPTNAELYNTLAAVASRKRDTDAAIAAYDKGIEALPEREGALLKFAKVQTLLQMNEIPKARKQLKALRKLGGVRTDLLDYLEARILTAEGQWFKAAEEFERLRAVVSTLPGVAVELNMMLGLCYEKLNQNDKALRSYDLAIQADATNRAAALGRDRILTKQGKSQAENQSYSIYKALNDELAKDESDQDWEAFDILVQEYTKRLELSEAMQLVLRGEVDMRRELYAKARAKLLKAYKLEPDNLGVRRAAVKLFASDPDQGPEKALKLLDKVVEDLGDLPVLRLDRAKLYIAIDNENLNDELFSITEGMEEWETEKQIQVLNGLAQVFSQLKDNESRQACLVKIAELSPSDLATLQNLFMMARQENDLAGMSEMQDRILKVVGSKDRTEWMFTEAHRLVSLYRSQDRDNKYLDDAEALVMRSLDSRPEWHHLYLVKAEVELLRQNIDGALESFDKASELGRPTVTSLFQHVKLLISRFRFTDALREMGKISEEARTKIFGRDYTNALLNTGRIEEALLAAEAVSDSAPNDPRTQLWYGRTLTSVMENGSLSDERRDSLRKKSGEILRSAVDLEPNSNEAWGSLHHLPDCLW